jgi:hypothetical protein
MLFTFNRNMQLRKNVLKIQKFLAQMQCSEFHIVQLTDGEKNELVTTKLGLVVTRLNTHLLSFIFKILINKPNVLFGTWCMLSTTEVKLDLLSFVPSKLFPMFSKMGKYMLYRYVPTSSNNLNNILLLNHIYMIHWLISRKI